MSWSDLEPIVDRYHHALDAFVRGDPALQRELFSRQDDVTLANPLGPPARGRHQIEQVMERAASMLREGEPNRFERVTAYAGTDVAYMVEIERTNAKVRGSDEMLPVSLRVTTVFRMEDGEWKVAHRQADPITSPRTIDTIVDIDQP
ncbi:nuclear transport factor 2 family protein [Arthrobacter sp. NPDC089319]|uniref:YybH family protein n=1 Tax=Arthrobacter sp. NPDC089319 TaxID=3155915 RepID=UPI00343A824F